MTDSIRIFEPGFQVTNSSNTPQSGAVLRFFNAGTSDTRTVYSNSGLTTSLGVTVTCNSAGRPASGGNEVSIFTGTTAYKVTAETSAAVSLWSFDNQLGALDTSGFDATAALPETPVLTKTGDYTILSADKGNVINFNATLGATATLPSAVTMGDGWRIAIRHSGTATAGITISPVGGQTLDGATSQALRTRNASRWLVSDAANWFTDSSHGIPSKITSFATDGTYTKPSGLAGVTVICTAGGAGGGGADGSDTEMAAGGGGGGAGGTSIRYLFA